MLLFTLLHLVIAFVVAYPLFVGGIGENADNGLGYGAINKPGSHFPEVLDTADQRGQEQDASFPHLWNTFPTSKRRAEQKSAASADYDTLSLEMDQNLVLPAEKHTQEVELLGDDYFEGAHSWKSAAKTEGAHHGETGIITLQETSEEDGKFPDQVKIVHKRLRRSVVGTAKSTPADITNLFEGKVDKAIRLAEGGGVPLNIATNFSSTSPEQLASTTGTPLDDNHQSVPDFTHSVEGGGIPLNRDSPKKLENLTQTSLATTLQTETTITNISIHYNKQGDPNNVPTSTIYSDLKSHKTVPRKGAEAGKIVGRKGVDEISASAIPTSTNDASSSLILTTNHSIDGVLIAHLNSSLTNTSLLPSLSVDGKVEIIESNPPLKKKPKPKPLTLTDKTSFNTTPAPHDHVSSQRDLVVPVVVLILAVPLVTILGIFLYKKGSEYWSRRHYRRMDFLIDGMYND